MSVVPCFAGGIKSGKTTLAGAVAKRLGLEVASFGDFVRAAARDRGQADTRENLQALGEGLIRELGFGGFCRAVLESSGWAPGGAVVVDGIRHVAAYEEVKSLVAPVPTKLVFVETSEDIRRARLANDARRPGEAADLKTAELHSTEKDVHGALRGIVDLAVDGARPPEELVEEVCRFLLR